MVVELAAAAAVADSALLGTSEVPASEPLIVPVMVLVELVIAKVCVLACDVVSGGGGGGGGGA